MTKKNDWFVTRLMQPDMSLEELAIAGINTDNTGLQDKDYYKNNEKIKEKFTDDTGKFDEKKFDAQYDIALKSYNIYANYDFDSTILTGNVYHEDQLWLPDTAITDDTNPVLRKAFNPYEVTTGFDGYNQQGAQVLSERELAQKNKVVDFETGETLDYTPNDMGFLKSLTAPSLALATWDEDGVHTDLMSGVEVEHKAGEKKLNADGKFYYETLAGRDPSKKTMLTVSDTLTTDGSAWNKIDFMDSDGLDKSIGGTIMKTAFHLGAYLIPFVRPVWTGMAVAYNLSKFGVAASRSINGIINDDDIENREFKNFSGFLSRFDSTVSDNSRENWMSWENIGSMASMISGQLYQQRFLSSIPKELGKFKQIQSKYKGIEDEINAAFKDKNFMQKINKMTSKQINDDKTLSRWHTALTNRNQELEKWNKASRTLATSYMAATASSDMYNTVKHAGGSDRMAGLGVLGVMAGMGMLMKNDYFKGMLFSGSNLDELSKTVNTAAKGSADDMMKSFTEQASAKAAEIATDLTPVAAAKGFAKFTKGFVSKVEKILSRKGDDMWSAALIESAEEVSEEGLADLTKSVLLGLQALGMDGNLTSSALFADAGQRYAMSAIGGAIGGPMFKLQNKLSGVQASDTPDLPADKQMVELISNGHAGKLRDKLEKLHKKGALGNKQLSADYQLDSDGNVDFLPASDTRISQNDLVYSKLMAQIDNIEKLLQVEGMRKSNQETMFDMLSKGARKDAILDFGIHTSAVEDFRQISTDLTNALIEHNNAIKSGVDPSQISELNAKISDLRKERDAMINGERNAKYYAEGMFALSPTLHDGFLSSTKEELAIDMFKQNLNSLTDKQHELLDAAYKANLSSGAYKSKFKIAFDIFSKFNQTYSKGLADAAKKNKGVNINPLLSSDTSLWYNDSVIYALNPENEDTRTFGALLDKVISDRSLYTRDVATHIERLLGLMRRNIVDENGQQTEAPLPQTESEMINLLQSSVAGQKYDSSLLFSDNEIGAFAYSVGVDNMILDMLNGNMDTDTDAASEFLENVSKELGFDIVDYAKAKNLLKGNAANEATDILDDFIKTIQVDINGTEIDAFEVLWDQIRHVQSVSANEYVISDPDITEKLHRAHDTLTYISDIVNAGQSETRAPVGLQSGYNQSINKMNEDNELGELDEQQTIQIKHKLARLQSRIHSLIMLSEKNANSMIRRQRDTVIVTSAAKLEALKEVVASSEFPVQGIVVPDISFDVKASEEDNLAAEVALHNFERDVYAKIKAENVSIEDWINFIKTKFPAFVDNNPTILSYENATYPDMEKAKYLTSIAFTDMGLFYDKFKSIMNNAETPFYATYTQEEALRLSYAFYNNKEVFNALAAEMGHAIGLDDFIFIGGVGGSGKTYIANIFLKLIDADPNTTGGVVPNPTKKRDLEKGISAFDGRPDNVVLKNEILSKILTQSGLDKLKSSNIKDDEEAAAVMIEDFTDEDFIKDGMPFDVLIIDEITLFTIFEQKAIVEAVKRKQNSKSFVMGLGDPTQPGAGITSSNGTKYISVNIDEANAVWAPMSGISLRFQNNQKQKNLSYLSRIISNFIYEPIQGDRGKKMVEAIKEAKPTVHYHMDGSKLSGDLFIQKSQSEDWLNGLLKEVNDTESSLMIVVDASELKNYSHLAKDNKIQVLTLDDIQGAEVDYIYVHPSVNVGRPDINSINEADFNHIPYLQSMYMIMSRSRKGSILFQDEHFSPVFFENVMDSNTHEVVLNQRVIDDYRSWRSSVVNQFGDSTVEEQTEEKDVENPDAEESDSENNQIDDEENNEPVVFKVPKNKQIADKGKVEDENKAIETEGARIANVFMSKMGQEFDRREKLIFEPSINPIRLSGFPSNEAELLMSGLWNKFGNIQNVDYPSKIQDLIDNASFVFETEGDKVVVLANVGDSQFILGKTVSIDSAMNQLPGSPQVKSTKHNVKTTVDWDVSQGQVSMIMPSLLYADGNVESWNSISNHGTTTYSQPFIPTNGNKAGSVVVYATANSGLKFRNTDNSELTLNENNLETYFVLQNKLTGLMTKEVKGTATDTDRAVLEKLRNAGIREDVVRMVPLRQRGFTLDELVAGKHEVVSKDSKKSGVTKETTARFIAALVSDYAANPEDSSAAMILDAARSQSVYKGIKTGVNVGKPYWFTVNIGPESIQSSDPEFFDKIKKLTAKGGEIKVSMIRGQNNVFWQALRDGIKDDNKWSAVQEIFNQVFPHGAWLNIDKVKGSQKLGVSNEALDTLGIDAQIGLGYIVIGAPIQVPVTPVAAPSNKAASTQPTPQETTTQSNDWDPDDIFGSSENDGWVCGNDLDAPF